MREILFRGKDIDGKWVEGCCIVDEMDTNKVYIGYIFGSDGRQPHDTDVSLVDPKTVCQYTGLTDKNGRKIFEGDILSFSAYSENYKGDVRFIKGNFTIWCEKCAPFLDDALEKHSAIVIGNIFDNPELIGEQP